MLTDRGHRVIGVDLDPAAVAAIDAGRAPVAEPGLQDRIDSAGRRLGATTEFAPAIGAAEIVVIATPAPGFAAVPASVVAGGDKRRVVLDCWRVLRLKMAEAAEFVHPGRADGLSRPIAGP